MSGGTEWRLHGYLHVHGQGLGPENVTLLIHADTLALCLHSLGAAVNRVCVPQQAPMPHTIQLLVHNTQQQQLRGRKVSTLQHQKMAQRIWERERDLLDTPSEDNSLATALQGDQDTRVLFWSSPPTRK
jgi:hypothetical protein